MTVQKLLNSSYASVYTKKENALQSAASAIRNGLAYVLMTNDTNWVLVSRRYAKLLKPVGYSVVRLTITA